MTPGDLVLTPKGLRFRGRIYPCAIGHTSLTSAKREGDGATPRGFHTITDMLFRPDRIARPAPWASPIRPGDIWSDAPEHPAYNTKMRAPYPASHESLCRADPLYDLILVTDWNMPAEPYQGSAIFLHRWRKPRHPTEGCVALHPTHLAHIARAISPGTRLIVPLFLSC